MSDDAPLKAFAVTTVALVATVGLSSAIGRGYCWWSLPGVVLLLVLLIPDGYFRTIVLCGFLLAGRYLTEQAYLLAALCSLISTSLAIGKRGSASEKAVSTFAGFALLSVGLFFISSFLPYKGLYRSMALVTTNFDVKNCPDLLPHLKRVREIMTPTTKGDPPATATTPVAGMPSTTPNRPGHPPATTQSQIAGLEGRIERWKTNKSKFGDLFARLRKDRQGLLTRLNELGVRSAGDGSSDPRAKVLLEELRDVLRQLATCEKKQEDYDLAVFTSESRLRTIERRLSAKEAGINDADLGDLARSMLNLEESLASEEQPTVPVALDDLLAKELTNFRED